MIIILNNITNYFRGEEVKDKIKTLLKELKMNSALEHFDSSLKQYNDRESFILSLLEIESRQRNIRSVQRKITQADFPLDREWSMIDEKRNPCINFNEIKVLSNGKFVEEKRNVCFVGAPGIGKTHSAVSIGKDLCRKGIGVKCYTASDLVTALEEAKQKGELSKLMIKLMKPKLLLIDELGFVPFSDNGARLLFDIFSKRYEHGSIMVTTNLAFNKWPSIFGSIELTAALIDRFTHKCDIFVYKGDSVRFFESQKRNTKAK